MLMDLVLSLDSALTLLLPWSVIILLFFLISLPPKFTSALIDRI